jgi:uncharacterized protein
LRFSQLTAWLCFIAPAFSAQALEPGFDCTKADSDAEEAICQSEALADLDLELSRLYRAAIEGSHINPDRKARLQTEQRGWIKGRNECWKSSLGLETCVANSYAARIHDIREGYVDSRTEGGKSTGPFAVVCDGLDGIISAVFVNTVEPLVSLKWRTNSVILPLSPSGSGAKYESDAWSVPGAANGSVSTGTTTFWTKGEEALFRLPGGPSLNCVFDETG